MRFPLLAVAVTACALTAQAVPIAYEGFDYAVADPLLGKTGGTGWSAGWTNSGTGSVILSPGLTYTDANSLSLVTTGNSGQFAGGNNGNFRLTLSSPETAGTSLYVSFIAKMDAASTNAYAGVSLFSGGTETLFLGDPSGPTNWGIDTKSGSVLTGTTPVNTQTFLVYKIDFLASSAEIRLFENPLLGIEPANSSATVFATKTAALAWTQIRVQSSHAGLVDEIRIGTTYADVTPAVPEPALCGLLGVGAFLMSQRRRLSEKRS